MEEHPSELVQKVLHVADHAGAILLQHFKTALKIDYKQDEFDPVTVADRESDVFIREQLHTIFPSDRILSEENTNIPDDYSGRVWMVDPLDGTKAFVKGWDAFSVLIGLVENGAPVLGCVTLPAQGRVFCGEKGKGAFEKVDGTFKKMHTSPVRKMQDSRLVVRRSSAEARPIEEQLDRLQFMRRVEETVGNKVCMVARGEAEAYINTNFRASKWDIAAPQVILGEAGGVVTDLDGNPIDYKKDTQDLGRSYVASGNKELHEEILGELRRLNV